MEYIKKRTIFFISTFVLLFIASCSGQQSPKPPKEDVLNKADSIDKAIKEIRKEYSKINSDTSKYSVVQKDINGESAEGGILKKFFENDVLRKAVEVFFGETGKLTAEYYFKDEEIIFVYEREDRYDSPIYEGNGKIKSTVENRYYFNHKKLIRWIGSDGKVVKPEQYLDKENEILDDLKNEILPKLAF